LENLILPYLFPAFLFAITMFMSFREYKSYKKNQGCNKAKVKLIRRLIGIFFLILSSAVMTIGLHELSLKRAAFSAWIFLIVFLAIAVFIGVWDASSEMRAIKTDLKTECEEDMKELIKIYEQKTKEKSDSSES